MHVDIEPDWYIHHAGFDHTCFMRVLDFIGFQKASIIHPICCMILVAQSFVDCSFVDWQRPFHRSDSAIRHCGS